MAGVVSHGCQTIYRDSEAQTRPWTPPYTLLSAETPEILTLACLTWGNGLPAGQHEVDIIERLRKKAAWEKVISSFDKLDQIKLRQKIINDIENDEWVFREKELESVNKERMELAKQMMSKQKDYFMERMVERMNFRRDISRKNKEEQLKKINEQRDKELRRVEYRTREENMKKQRPTVFELTNDHSSNLYAFKARDGYHRKNMSIVLCKEARIPTTELDKLNIPITFDLCQGEKKLKIVKHDCVNKKYEKMTADEIDEYSRQLKMFYGIHEFDLKKKKQKPKMTKEDNEGEFDEMKYLSAVILQKVMKGRAVQTVMQEGRKKNQGLIDELTSTFGLIPDDIIARENERQTMLKSFRNYCIGKEKLNHILGTIASLEGSVLSRLLDLTSKELIRIQEEKKLIALALFAQAQRWKYEAWEAGRRQKERRRKRQQQEIYRQLVEKIDEGLEYQMEDILRESIFSSSVITAEEEIRKKCLAIEDAADTVRRVDYNEQEELVSRLMNQVLLPEVAKFEARRSLWTQQEIYRQEAQRFLYKDGSEESEESKEREDIDNEDELKSRAKDISSTVLEAAVDLFDNVFHDEGEEGGDDGEGGGGGGDWVDKQATKRTKTTKSVKDNVATDDQLLVGGLLDYDYGHPCRMDYLDETNKPTMNENMKYVYPSSEVNCSSESGGGDGGSRNSDWSRS